MNGIKQDRWVRRVEKDVDWHVKQEGVRQANRSLQLKLNAFDRKLREEDQRIRNIKEERFAVKTNKEVLKRMLAKDFEKLQRGDVSEYQFRLKFLTLEDENVLKTLVNTKKKHPVNDCTPGLTSRSKVDEI
jgi:hypothetical protein